MGNKLALTRAPSAYSGEPLPVSVTSLLIMPAIAEKTSARRRSSVKSSGEGAISCKL
jgi:hypothetical protein